MLDSLRLFAKSWPGKIMGGFLLVGIAGFGINNVIADLGSNTVARIGNQEISSRAFLRAYQNQMNQVAQQIGRMPTQAEAESFGVPSMVLQRLGQDGALDQMTSDFGLGVSEQKLSEMLREDRNFAGTLGTFDPTQFAQVLQQSGLTEAEYFKTQADSARRQQLIVSLFADVKLPVAASDLLNRFSGDQRSVDYFVIGDTNIETPAAPTEDELAAYLTQHQTEFRTVETRTVQVLELTPAALAATKTVTDEQVAAEYERIKPSLTTPERRSIQQVLLSTPELVAAFEAGKTAGTPFATLIADAKLTPTDLGTLAQADITDTNLATAAFGLPADGFVIIDGVAGKRAVNVSDITAGGQETLEQARPTIVTNLTLALARTDMATVLDQIEELRAAFQPLPQIAERFGLKVYDLKITAAGTELTAIPDLNDQDRPRVAQAIFKATEGSLTPMTQLAGNGSLWFDLSKIEAARDQTLDEVHDAVVTALTTERTNNAVMAAADAAVKRLDNGEAFADIAASLNVFPQLSPQFTRGGAADTTIDGAVAGAVFNGGPEHHGTAINANGEQVVFQVANVTAADGELAKQASDNIENEVRVGLYGDFVTAVSQEAGLRVNQQALTQALSLTGGQ